jgi:hypothetical protein
LADHRTSSSGRAAVGGALSSYVKHRLRRLPDPPHQIARGIFAGVFTTFTPFFGLHFVVAAILAEDHAWQSCLPSLLATFFGNPLTYVPSPSCRSDGPFPLGTSPRARGRHESIFAKFGGAAGDLWHNVKAIFTGAGGLAQSGRSSMTMCSFPGWWAA